MAEQPLLFRFNPATAANMRLVLSAKGASGAAGQESLGELTRLRRYADEDLKKKLEPVEGVAAVKVGGGLEDEIQVAIDQQKLAQLGVSLDTVIKRLTQETINIQSEKSRVGKECESKLK